MVTVSAIGYGDKVPRTQPGRLFAYAWIVIGIVLFATLTGEISASLIAQSGTDTTSTLQYTDFKDVKICSYLAGHWLHQQNTHDEENVKNCMQQLEAGLVDAVFYDLAILQDVARCRPVRSTSTRARWKITRWRWHSRAQGSAGRTSR